MCIKLGRNKCQTIKTKQVEYQREPKQNRKVPTKRQDDI